MQAKAAEACVDRQNVRAGTASGGGAITGGVRFAAPEGLVDVSSPSCPASFLAGPWPWPLPFPFPQRGDTRARTVRSATRTSTTDRAGE